MSLSDKLYVDTVEQIILGNDNLMFRLRILIQNLLDDLDCIHFVELTRLPFVVPASTASSLQTITQWDHIALETFVLKYQFANEIRVLSLLRMFVYFYKLDISGSPGSLLAWPSKYFANQTQYTRLDDKILLSLVRNFKRFCAIALFSYLSR